MRRLHAAAVASAMLVPACVPGGIVYFGLPLVTLDGHVYQYEAQTPARDAEVCVFGTDTLCVATTGDGHYRTAVGESFLLADSALTLRFRISGLRPAVAHLRGLTTGSTYTTDCGISNRVGLTREAATCLPIPER